MKLQKCILGLIFVLCAGATRAADELPEHTYWVRVLGNSQSCQQQAEQLAQDFANATKIRVGAFTCEGSVNVIEDGQTFTYNSISIKYKSYFQPGLYTAQYSFSSREREPQGEMGYFVNLSTCAAAVDSRKQEFLEQTGLLPIATTCELVESYSSPASVVLKVQGFGQPKKRLFQASLPAAELVPQDQAHQAFKNIFSLKKVQVVGEQGGHFLFYRDQYLDIQYALTQYMAKEQECLDQKQGLLDFFVRAGSVAPVVGCSKHDFPTGTFFALWGIGESDKFLSESAVASGMHYYSFEECMADRPRVVESRRISKNDNLLATCAPERTRPSRNYEMQVSIFR
jgi:hypothetical protein